MVVFYWEYLRRYESVAGLSLSRNQVYGEPYRGFESLPLRQFFRNQFYCPCLQIGARRQPVHVDVSLRGRVAARVGDAKQVAVRI